MLSGKWSGRQVFSICLIFYILLFVYLVQNKIDIIFKCAELIHIFGSLNKEHRNVE